MQKRSSVRPYTGDQPFVFISYCRKDSPFVFPILENLARRGARLWFDVGIIPSSEWNEVLANQIKKSHICLAFITANAVDSSNCKREINFALQQNKPLLSVFLEEAKLTPGLEMQLSANQGIFSYSYPNVEQFLQALMAVPALAASLDQADPSIEIRPPSFCASGKAVSPEI